MVTIIYCHPSKNSHNHKILQRVKKTLKQKNQKFEVLDLYKMDFEASLDDTEYQRIKKHRHVLDRDVKAIQKKIKASKTLIFIYPIWWFTLPALLTGFIDRVFTKGFAYKFRKVNRFFMFMGRIASWIPGFRYLLQPYLAIPKLKGKKALIFRSYGGPSFSSNFFDNPQKILENAVLRFCGITDIELLEIFNVDIPEVYTQDYEDEFMKEVEEVCQEI